MTNYRLTPLRDTAKNKARIIENTRGRMESQALKTSKRKRPLVPVLVTACMLILTLFLAGPYVYQAFFMQQKFTVEKVVFPQSAHDALYHAVYIDATNEFVYKKEDGFYSFDVATKQETLLVAGSKMSYGYAASEKWIVWGAAVNNEEKLHVFNRLTNEVKIIETDYFFDVHLQGDEIIYLALKPIDGSRSEVSYQKYNILTEQSTIIQEIDVTSTGTMSFVDGNYMTISNQIDMDDEEKTIISVHDLQQLTNVGTYNIPYDTVQDISLHDNKIYARVWHSNVEQPGEIGVLDLETNRFTTLKTSVKIDDFATDGEHFAVAVQKGDSNSVQLFEEREGQLKRISSLPTINERLVLPRFTEDGTLVVTSEGPDRPIYLIRFKE